MVKNLPVMQKMQEMPLVPSLGQEDPLEEGMAIHASTLALENPMDSGGWQATVHRVAQSQDTTEHECKNDYHVDLIDKSTQV